MNKIFCTLILIAMILTGCIIATPFNDETAERGLTNLHNSLDDGRINEVWYRMSYEIRDRYDYKFFVDNWENISNNLSEIFDGQVTARREIHTWDNLQGVVLKLSNESRIIEILFVAELDKARFPGETEVVWRFRGVFPAQNELDFGFVPKTAE